MDELYSLLDAFGFDKRPGEVFINYSHPCFKRGRPDLAARITPRGPLMPGQPLPHGGGPMKPTSMRMSAPDPSEYNRRIRTQPLTGGHLTGSYPSGQGLLMGYANRSAPGNVDATAGEPSRS